LIPRFFKDMPPKNKRNKNGKWRIEVRTIFPTRDNIIYSEIYEGKLWIAYVKVRLRAFIKDISTSGEYYGIGWSIKKG